MDLPKKTTILAVEDDEFFRAAMKDMLENLGYAVLEAPNGKVAKDILTMSHVDLVIADVQMPYLTGVELLDWAHKNCPKPFILISGFGTIPDMEKAHEMGMEEFLSKPIPTEELTKAVFRALPSRAGEEELMDGPGGTKENNEPQKYCKVSLEDFVSEKSAQMELFIKLSEKKYVRIAHKGGKIPQERIEQYKHKGVTQLYIKAEDFSKVLDFNVKLSKVVAASPQVNKEKKTRFLLNTAEVILENTFINGVDEKAFDEAKDFMSHSLEHLTNDQQTLDLLEIISGHTDFLYAHSLGVSIYSVMIAQKAGWKSTANLFKLGFAGLMHDVGKKEIPTEILNKSRALLSQKERMLFESHCLRGKEILESLKSAPTEVVEIAFQHHENCLGQGYPSQLNRSQIHPMARIVSIADEFCTYALAGPHKPRISAQKALHLMDQFKEEVLDPDFYQYFRKLILEEVGEKLAD